MKLRFVTSALGVAVIAALPALVTPLAAAKPHAKPAAHSLPQRHANAMPPALLGRADEVIE